MKLKTVSIFFIAGLFCGCSTPPQEESIVTQEDPEKEIVTEIRDDLETLFNDFELTGGFILFDENANKYSIYNQKICDSAFTPASTFKICNTIIGLETGVLSDADHLMKWDGTVHGNENWNQDHTLRSAMKNSTVWYYQKLAREIGEERMRHWMDTLNYGNGDISGGIDLFWLNGGLRISPKQEIDFLRRLKNEQLPVSQRSMDITKEIMTVEETPDYSIHAKTGWGIQGDEQHIGWYVGYVQTKENVYYFANCIQTNEFSSELANARVEIVGEILKKLNILE